MSPSKFPSEGIQSFSALLQFIAVTIVTHCLSCRVASERLTSLHHIMSIPLTRVALLFVFFDSWLFVLSSNIAVFGIGLERSLGACTAVGYSCASLYAISKAATYLFLVERMHIVWQPIGGQSRLKSPVYLLCAISAAGYVVLFIFLLVVQWPAFIDEQGMCQIGVKPAVTWSVVAFDLYINILLTTLFVAPLWHFRRRTNHVLRRLTQRTLIATFVSLSVSTANVLAFTLMHGKQQAWLCVATCTLDVVINALALFWATISPTPSAAYTEPGTWTAGPEMPGCARPQDESVAMMRFGTSIHMDMTQSTVQVTNTTKSSTIKVPVQFSSGSHSEIIAEHDITLSTLKSGVESDPNLRV